MTRAALGGLLCGGLSACGEANSAGTASGGAASGGARSGGASSGGAAPSGGARPGGAPSGGASANCEDASTSFSLEMAEVTGRLTKNGEPWIEWPGLQFVPRGEREVELNQGIVAMDRGDGTFAASLPHGAYDVRLTLRTGARLYEDVQAEGIEVRGPTHVELEFPMVHVSGEVRLAGGAFPTDDGNRGQVCLHGKDSDTSTFCQSVSQGPTATFALEVPSGTSYELRWSRGEVVENDMALNAVPSGEQSFGVKLFDRDTRLDLDIDAPSVVVSGTVNWEGTPFSDLTPRPTGFAQFGPLMVTLSEQGAATFQGRLLAGTYAPVVYLALPGGPGRYLRPCAEPGCTLSEDTEWTLDVSSPPTGVVEGEIDFATPTGNALPALPSDGGGIVHLDLQPETPGTTIADPNAFGGAYTVNLDASRRFRHEALPFGKYAVWYERADHPTAPVGTFRFDGALVVDREQVSWRQTATVAPVAIDVSVNGQAMSDDRSLEGEPRGVLLFADMTEGAKDGPHALRLELGETGAVHFDRLFLAGRYAASVSANTPSGRTYLRGLKQDVLPIGRSDLGVLDTSAAASGSDPTPFAVDLQVREVEFDVQNTTPLLTSALPYVMASLTSQAGHPFWAPAPTVGEKLRLLVYAGCYSVAALPTEAPWFPDARWAQRETRLGQLCTCEAEAPMP